MNYANYKGLYCRSSPNPIHLCYAHVTAAILQSGFLYIMRSFDRHASLVLLFAATPRRNCLGFWIDLKFIEEVHRAVRVLRSLFTVVECLETTGITTSSLLSLIEYRIALLL